MDIQLTAWNKERVLSLKSWHDDWKGLKTAVLGLGVTGFSVADTLAELGSEVLVIASSDDGDRQPLINVIGAKLELQETAEQQLETLKNFTPDLVVVSPGYRLDHPLTSWAQEQEVPVWGDIDLAWRLRDKTNKVADWICITGTNGKTTTSQLTAHMLVEGGFRAAPVGNIGIPVLDAIRDPEGFDVLVVELSSFQLARLQNISPYASVCLNIADDHLDWHGGFDEYVAAKSKVYENTQIACVFNRQDTVTQKMVEEANIVKGARAISFGFDTPPPGGFGLVEELLIDRGFHEDRRSQAFEIYSLDELEQQNMNAPHLVQDILAASALARSKDVSPDAISNAIKKFTPDYHRMQLVAKSGGVTWIDDSKATNSHAASASLGAYENIVWIAGGLLKGQNLDELIEQHKKRFRAVIVIGEDRTSVLNSLAKHAAGVPVTEIDSGIPEEVMDSVVQKAKAFALPGDTVLLSPAAASMDQFASFEDRGIKFQNAVIKLLGDGKTDAQEG